jgi:hypothetical protein
MAETLQSLERRRNAIAQQIADLGDMRPGSVTAIHKKCGKPSCCCTGEDHPGHGPHWRLTYKSRGRSLTESLTGAAIAKAEGEIAEFRRFQQLSRELIEISTRICQIRPAEPVGLQEKKRQMRSRKR